MNIVLGSIDPRNMPAPIIPFRPDPEFVQPTWQVSYPVASAVTVASAPPGMMINAQGKYYTPTPGALEYARSHPGWIDPAAVDANYTGGGGASGRIAAAASDAAARAGREAEAAQGAAMARASDRASAYTEGMMAAMAEDDEGPGAGISPVMLLAAAAAAYFALK